MFCVVRNEIPQVRVAVKFQSELALLDVAAGGYELRGSAGALVLLENVDAVHRAGEPGGTT